MLIDEILESHAIEEWHSRIPADELRRIFRQAFVVRCQNVWDYFDANLIGKVTNYEKFPNVAPPLPTMWFEWTANHTKIEDPITGVHRSIPLKLGILCFALDLRELNTERINTVREELGRFGINSLTETRWVMGGLVFSRILNPGEKPHALGRIDWRSGPNGELLTSAANGHFVHSVAPDYEDQRESVFTTILFSAASVCWQAISFMHCKNVRIEKGPAIPEKLRRARERNSKHPLFRHHTIIIDPSRTVAGSSSSGESVGNEKALHICRGHYKDFRERGLFGRQKGMYWWPMHKRGSAANGTVEKDYEVKP
jgi:hypothetical protein